MWYVGFPGNKQAEEFAKGAAERAKAAAGIVGEVATFVAETTLKIQAPINPIARKLLDEFFAPEPDPTDKLAEAEYLPKTISESTPEPDRH